MLAEALAAPLCNPAISPFAVTGPALIESGYSAIPIAPGDKIPGLYAGGEWRLMPNWQRFCEMPAPPNVIRGWSRMPDAGVGIALGRGVVAVDIDLDDAVGAVMAALPPAIVAKKGAKGLTLFFRGDTSKIKSRPFRIDGIGAVDLLSHGRQSVLPPSIHPKTGRPYEWMSFKTLAEVPLAELTEAPDNRGVTVDRVLDAFGKGDVLIGQAAVAAGMANAIGTFEGTLAALAMGKSISRPPTVARAVASSGPSQLAPVKPLASQPSVAVVAERARAREITVLTPAGAEADRDNAIRSGMSVETFRGLLGARAIIAAVRLARGEQ